MRCSSTCGVALPVFGLLSAIAVFAAQTTTTTGSDLAPAGGMVLASTRGTAEEVILDAANAETPAAINMNGWQETARRNGTIRRL